MVSTPSRFREASATLSGRGEPMAPGWLTGQLGAILPRDAIVVSELVTNASLTARHLPRSIPGSFFAAGGTSLGWGLSAAVGVQNVISTSSLRGLKATDFEMVDGGPRYTWSNYQCQRTIVTN